MPPTLLDLLSLPVLLFLAFAGGALVTAIMVVLYPNPIRSALLLVLNLFCVAVLYLLLNAYFLAAVQIIVYAGAIMVLFLFVIMLLNLGSPDRAADKLKWQQPVGVGVGVIVALLFSAVIFTSVPGKPYVKVRTMEMPSATGVSSAGGPPPEAESAPVGNQEGGVTVPPGRVRRADPMVTDPDKMGTVAGVGKALYNPLLPWLFPFEVTSILLLIAVIGSVALAKRRLPGGEEDGPAAAPTSEGGA